MRKFLSSECSIVVEHQFLMKTPKQVLTEWVAAYNARDPYILAALYFYLILSGVSRQLHPY